MPRISKDSIHWSARWPHLFISWHRGVRVTSWHWYECKGFTIGLPGGTIEVSWGPVSRSTGLH